jgi:hypothetical protein
VRGEVELRAGGRAWVMRPSFAALVAAEGELGSLWTLVERTAAGDLRLGEAVALMWHCLVEPAPRELFGEAVLENGLAAAMPIVHAVLRQVMAGR